MRILLLRKNLWIQKAIGLVEVLIALAVVGTAMVIITSISLRTIKQVRRNELQDVAIQAGVEAMDFMKQPQEIMTDQLPREDVGSFYSLDFGADPVLQLVVDAWQGSENGQIDTCVEGDQYYLESLEDYLICQQIYVNEVDDREYDLEVIVVWETVGGDFEKRTLSGFRAGRIKIGEE